MTRVKIAVSLPAELVDAARRAVATGRAASVSGYVEAALSSYDDGESFHDWVQAELQASGGPLTSEEQAWVDAALKA